MLVELVTKWNTYLNSFEVNQKDLYYYEEYVKMDLKKDEEAFCIICSEDKNILLMPFLRKKIGEYYDFETPYGYGGPISNCNNKEWIKSTLKMMKNYFKNEKYIAGFIRFNPLLNNADLCRDSMIVLDDRKTVAINTEVSEDEIWSSQISSKNRNMIRKAEKSGLMFILDKEFKYLEEFKNLYNSTMKRLDADDFYYFNNNYYQKFEQNFKNKGFIGCIKKDDEIIAAALFMFDGIFGHYHLAGSNREYSSLGTNNLLLWKVACELHKKGILEFHLGGGTDGNEENSLYKFKRSFSPNLKQFSIGKWIFNESVYSDLCSDWESKNPDKIEKYKHHLLKYRY